MSVRDETTGLEYAGALGLRGLFPTGRNLRRPASSGCCTEVPRFHRRARALLDQPAGTSRDQTLRDFLDQGGFTAYFCRHFMEPLVAAVWSCDPEVALDYPARYLFEFLAHHGMLSRHRLAAVADRRRRVPRVRRAGRGRSRRGEGRHQGHLGPGDGRRGRGDRRERRHHGVRRGGHRHPPRPGARDAGQEPTSAQREALAAIPYADNLALLHTDTSLLPRSREARAPRGTSCAREDGRGAGHRDLRPDAAPAAADRRPTTWSPSAARTWSTRDTVIDAHGVRAPALQPRLGRRPAAPARGRHRPARLRRRLPRLGVPRGRRALGRSPRPSSSGCRGTTPVPHRASPLRRARSAHTRRTPFRRQFAHRSHVWLVDLDALPDHGLLGAVRGPRPPRLRPTPRSAPTSTPSWPRTASTSTAAGC